MRYTDKFRANSVVMLEANGYPDDEYALSKTASYLNIPRMTLYRWYKRRNAAPPIELVTDRKKDLSALLENEIRGILDEMLDARQDADYREMGTVLGILFDKLQLLNNKPTESLLIEYTDSERVAGVAALLERARARRDGQIPIPTDD